MADAYKIILCGDRNVGKTVFTQVIIGGPFNPNYQVTISADSAKKCLNDKGIELQLCDIAGQELYNPVMTRAYYKGAHAAILVADATQKKSIQETLPRWITNIREKLYEDTPIYVLINKMDCSDTIIQDLKNVVTQTLNTFEIKEDCIYFVSVKENCCYDQETFQKNSNSPLDQLINEIAEKIKIFCAEKEEQETQARSNGETEQKNSPPAQKLEEKKCLNSFSYSGMKAALCRFFGYLETEKSNITQEKQLENYSANAIHGKHGKR